MIAFIALLSSSLFVSAAHAQRQPSAQPTPSRGGAITGRVVNEDNQPLTGIAVYARGVGANNQARSNSVTDESGRFTFRDLDAGAYTVTAYAPGYVPARTDESAATETLYRRPGDNFTLHMTKGGIITGRVMNAVGDPVIRIAVRPIRLQDETGRPVAPTFLYGQERRTDDRGIYRIYGLQPGTYIILAGASRQSFSSSPDAFGGRAPTYHPSATSDTAGEVRVAVGGETTGVDIIFRNEPGRRVSGTITGATQSAGNSGGINITLTNPANGIAEAATFIRPNERGFSFDGIPDGEYDLTARRSGSATETDAASPPRRIVVRGADITGIELALQPLASLSGQLRIEPLATALRADELCRDAAEARAMPQEAVIIARRNEPATNNREPRSTAFGDSTAPNSRGEFTLRNLEPGAYRFEIRPPGEHLYVSNITSSAPMKAGVAAKQNLPANEFTVATAASVPNIAITLATGAARVQGRITPASKDAALPSRLRVYLIPAATEHAEHGWRYRTTLAGADGRWTLANIAPGAYRILALPADDELRARNPRLLNADAQGRAELRRMMEAKGERIEFAPCAQITDYTLRYSHTAR